MAITSNLGNFDVQYEDYSDKTIKTVTIPLNTNQSMELSIVTDTTVDPNVKYIQINHKDELSTVEIPIIMTKDNLTDFMQLLRDMNARLI